MTPNIQDTLGQNGIDVEAIAVGGPSSSSTEHQWFALRTLWRLGSHDQTTDADPGSRESSSRIEDFPSGYPRFAALIASHGSFQIFRRFSNLRARLLLLKQDEISQLEQDLEHVDRSESIQQWHACSRKDKNPKRSSILANIEKKLADYDAFLERQYRSLQFEPAPERGIQSLRNWVRGNACLARAETDYLTNDRFQDRISLADPEDNAMCRLESFVEDVRIKYKQRFGKTKATTNYGSDDPHVHLFKGTSIRQTARLILAPVITMLLLAPVVVCNFLATLTSRLVVVVLATSIFVAFLSTLTRAKTVELIVAGATYTTVLVVFISN